MHEIPLIKETFRMSEKSTHWPKKFGGIYLIRCVTPSANKIYVGVASKSFNDRWRSHRTEMRGGKHGNSILQKSYDKYGESAFSFEIVEKITGESLDFFSKRENYWIDQLKSRVEHGGCNLQHGDYIPWYSEEAKKSQSNAATKRHGVKYKFKTPGGEIIDVDHLVNFCKEHGLNPVPMRWVFRGKNLSHKGYTAHDSNFVPICLREYIFVDPDGKEFETNNIKLFAEEHGLNPAALSSITSGVYRSHRGWTLKYAKRSARRKSGVYKKRPSREYDFIDPEGEAIHIVDLTLFCKENNLSRDRMVCAYNDPKTHHKGYRSLSSTLNPPCLRKIVVVSPDGVEYVTNNISAFEKEHGISATTLGSVYRGTTKQTLDGWKIKQ